MALNKNVKLDSDLQEKLWKLFEENDFEEFTGDINGQKVRVTILPNEHDEVTHEIESDPELRQMIMESQKDFVEGRYYSSDDIRDMIKKGTI